jgi:hypothetical protein
MVFYMGPKGPEPDLRDFRDKAQMQVQPVRGDGIADDRDVWPVD